MYSCLYDLHDKTWNKKLNFYLGYLTRYQYVYNQFYIFNLFKDLKDLNLIDLISHTYKYRKILKTK